MLHYLPAISAGVASLALVATMINISMTHRAWLVVEKLEVKRIRDVVNTALGKQQTFFLESDVHFKNVGKTPGYDFKFTCDVFVGQSKTNELRKHDDCFHSGRIKLKGFSGYVAPAETFNIPMPYRFALDPDIDISGPKIENIYVWIGCEYKTSAHIGIRRTSICFMLTKDSRGFPFPIDLKTARSEDGNITPMRVNFVGRIS